MAQVLFVTKEHEAHGHGAIKELVGINRDRIRIFNPFKQRAILIRQEGGTAPAGIYMEVGPGFVGDPLNLLEIIYTPGLGSACNAYNRHDFGLVSAFRL